jgi:methyl-accepting chemotaxis protein
MIDSRRPALHRRRFIVDRHFQHRLIRTFLATWLAHSVVFGLMVYFFYADHLERFYEIEPRPGLVPWMSPSALLAFSVASVVVCGFVAFLMVAVYMSNQIAGPLYRTKQGLDRVGRGEFSFHLQFRTSDFLRDVPVAFNNMLDSLRHQAETELDELREIEADDDPAAWKGLVRRQIERREAQLGLGPDAGAGTRETASLSVTVH